MAYHTTATASPEEMCDRAERTLDRAVSHGFYTLQAGQQQYMDEFWRRSDVQLSGIDEARVKRTTVEIQQAIRFNLYHVLQASARAETTGVAAKGLTGHAYEGHYFWDTETYLMPFLIYTSPRIAKNLLMFRYNMLDQARERATMMSMRGAMLASIAQRTARNDRNTSRIAPKISATDQPSERNREAMAWRSISP